MKRIREADFLYGLLLVCAAFQISNVGAATPGMVADLPIICRTPTEAGKAVSAGCWGTPLQQYYAAPKPADLVRTHPTGQPTSWTDPQTVWKPWMAVNVGDWIEVCAQAAIPGSALTNNACDAWRWIKRARTGELALGGKGTAVLSWTPPTKNTDDTPVMRILGYRLFWGPTPTSLPNTLFVGSAVTSYTLSGLPSGTMVYFAISTVGETAESDPAGGLAKLITDERKASDVTGVRVR